MKMTPAEAKLWLEEDKYTGRVPQLHARRALQAIVDMDMEKIVTEPHPRGSWNGDYANPAYFPDTPPGVAMSRYVTEWEE